jgi:hypothetical protein
MVRISAPADRADRAQKFSSAPVDDDHPQPVIKVDLPVVGMKWPRSPNLRKRPAAPAKDRGRVQRAIKRAFAATGAEVLSASVIYDWTHPRRRMRRKSMPFGIYSRTFRTLRTMADPIERVPPYGASCGAPRAV